MPPHAQLIHEIYMLQRGNGPTFYATREAANDALARAVWEFGCK
jgi:hypothetical protein